MWLLLLPRNGLSAAGSTFSKIQEAENSTPSPHLNPARIRVRALVGQGTGPRRPLENFSAVVGTMATSANAEHGQELGGTNHPRFSPGTSLRMPRQRGRELCLGSVCRIYPWGNEKSCTFPCWRGVVATLRKSQSCLRGRIPLGSGWGLGACAVRSLIFSQGF